MSDRLPPPYGSALVRDRPIDFTFEGRRFSGYLGDTVASALWAAGVRTLSRSFKYKRPRGILSATGFDGGALVQVGDEPNVPADRLALAPGMPPVSGQNYSGSLAHDRGAWVGWFGRFMPVGFYYRTFFRSPGGWPFYERIIRRRAGLGRLTPSHAHPPRTDKQYLFCDVCVIGAGPAGLAAAQAAADAGAEVILVDALPDAPLGLRSAGKLPDRVRVLTSAIAQGLYADNWLAIETEQRLYKLRGTQIVIATGTFEQPMVFRNNDLPGVMFCSAAMRLVSLYGVRPGRRAVVCVNNGDGLEAALRLLDAGVELAAVADIRSAAESGPVRQQLVSRGVEVLNGYAPYEATAYGGPLSSFVNGGLTAIRLARVGADHPHPLPGPTIACDLLCMSGGFAPNAALACHAGARLAYSPAQQRLAVVDLPAGIELAGSVRGAMEVDTAVADGRAAGARAAALAMGTPPSSARAPEPPTGGSRDVPVVPHASGKAFVDFDEDLTVADIENGIADGFTHLELLKRYSTAGMGPSQGKFSASGTVRVAAETLGVAAEELGTTTLRPPFTGARFRLLAGRGFSPYRYTAMHRRHIELGAQMMNAGLWYRPAYYGKPEEQVEAIRREVHAVRNGVGLIDVSTLGGIEVGGPDAAAFISRIYTTPHLKQPVGRTRYVLLCDEGGAIVDDGVACRLGENRFYLTATTSAVDQTYRKMLWLNAQWRMKIDIVNVTAAFSAVNIAGPKAREVLARIPCDIDLSAQAFPYLDVRVGTLGGLPVRMLRVGFVGELGYEIHVPTPYGLALWDLLTEAGRASNMAPFGVEAQRVLRLEKGHVIVGQDTDGLTHPFEAGLDFAVPKSKTEYVGMAAVKAQVARGITRRLVGFKMAGATPPPECCLVLRDGRIAGRVTSAAHSDACGGIIGLAYVAPEDSAIGSPITIKLPDGHLVNAHVVPIPFYDPDHARQAL